MSEIDYGAADGDMKAVLAAIKMPGEGDVQSLLASLKGLEALGPFLQAAGAMQREVFAIQARLPELAEQETAAQQTVEKAVMDGQAVIREAQEKLRQANMVLDAAQLERQRAESRAAKLREQAQVKAHKIVAAARERAKDIEAERDEALKELEQVRGEAAEVEAFRARHAIH